MQGLRVRLLRVEEVSGLEADVVYVNYTDGALLLDRVLAGVRRGCVVVTRLKSSHLERNRPDLFLQTVPDDMWYRLATGQTIVFIDAGSRRPDCLPRTMWMGVPLIIGAAYRLIWALKPENTVPEDIARMLGPLIARGVEKWVEEVLQYLPDTLERRIMYWHHYATPKPQATITLVYGCAAKPVPGPG